MNVLWVVVFRDHCRTCHHQAARWQHQMKGRISQSTRFLAESQQVYESVVFTTWSKFWILLWRFYLPNAVESLFAMRILSLESEDCKWYTDALTCPKQPGSLFAIHMMNFICITLAHPTRITMAHPPSKRSQTTCLPYEFDHFK